MGCGCSGRKPEGLDATRLPSAHSLPCGYNTVDSVLHLPGTNEGLWGGGQPQCQTSSCKRYHALSLRACQSKACSVRDIVYHREKIHRSEPSSSSFSSHDIQGLDIDPNHLAVSPAYLQEEGNLEAAIQCFETALSIDVHYAKSSLLLGVLYRQRGRSHDLTLAQVCSPSVRVAECTLTCYQLCVVYWVLCCDAGDQSMLQADTNQTWQTLDSHTFSPTSPPRPFQKQLTQPEPYSRCRAADQTHRNLFECCNTQEDCVNSQLVYLQVW